MTAFYTASALTMVVRRRKIEPRVNVRDALAVVLPHPHLGLGVEACIGLHSVVDSRVERLQRDEAYRFIAANTHLRSLSGLWHPVRLHANMPTKEHVPRSESW